MHGLENSFNTFLSNFFGRECLFNQEERSFFRIDSENLLVNLFNETRRMFPIRHFEMTNQN